MEDSTEVTRRQLRFQLSVLSRTQAAQVALQLTVRDPKDKKGREAKAALDQCVTGLEKKKRVVSIQPSVRAQLVNCETVAAMNRIKDYLRDTYPGHQISRSENQVLSQVISIVKPAAQ